jgi:hypothetical protein
MVSMRVSVGLFVCLWMMNDEWPLFLIYNYKHGVYVCVCAYVHVSVNDGWRMTSFWTIFVTDNDEWCPLDQEARRLLPHHSWRPRGASPLAASFLKMQASMEAEKSRTEGCNQEARRLLPRRSWRCKLQWKLRKAELKDASLCAGSLSRYIWLDRLLLFPSLLTRLVTTTHNRAPVLLMDPWLDPLFGWCTLWEWMHSAW